MVIVSDSLSDLLLVLDKPKVVFNETCYLGNPDSSYESCFGFRDLRSSIAGVIMGLGSADYSRLIEEVLLNSAGHGNGWDSAKPLTVVIYAGVSNWLLSVTDSGDGFDYKRVEREGVFHNFGVGFEFYKASKLKVSFDNNGRTISLLSNY